MEKNPKIAFVLGSKSDLPLVAGAKELLDKMGVPHEVRILSAHRTPDRAHEFARSARERGLVAVVAVAGMAAHLAGVLAASTDVPILGVPAPGGALQGMDALLSTVQMPGGVPVATFSIGKAGATNAAVFACRMMALTDADMAAKLRAYREEMEAKVAAHDEEVRANEA